MANVPGPQNGITLGVSKIIAISLATGVLLLAGEVVPDIAMYTAGLIFFASVLQKSGQLVTLGNLIRGA